MLKHLKGKWALATLPAAMLLAAMPAQAFQLQTNNPDLSGSLNTTLSAGAVWRVENQDKRLAANGKYKDLWDLGVPSQIDKNDANNNFDTGLASLVYKISPELQLTWQNRMGVVVSGTYFYDQRIMDGTRDGGYDVNEGCVTNPAVGVDTGYNCIYYPDNGDGKRFSKATKRYAGKYGRMLDTYVWADFDLGEMPLTVKLGRQVINWGESLFITGGVNSANYYDRNALMLPGSEIREALLPLDAIHFNLGLTDNLTAEAFYQFNWKHDFDAPYGSFWNTGDSFPGNGANNVIVDGEALGAAMDANGNLFWDDAKSMSASAAFAGYNNAVGGGNAVGLQQDQVTLKRAKDAAPKDEGQFGFAFKYIAENLNYTNFSFYFTNTHAKRPVVGAKMGEADWIGNGGAALCAGDPLCAQIASSPTGVGALNAAHMINTTEYFLVYPEDIQMYGFSFNTSIGKLALSGEIAYRPTHYVINEYPDNLIAEVAHAAQALSNNPSAQVSITDHCVRNKIGGDCLPGGLIGNDGKSLYFYDEAQSYIGSLVGIYTFGPMVGADSVIGLVEAGMEYLDGLNSDLRYGSTASVMQIDGDPLAQEGSKLHPNHPYSTYLDTTSWGYRAAVLAEYNSLIPRTIFKPSLQYAHDVRGNSAIGGNFMEGRRAATLTLGFDVMNQVNVKLAGTTFWGAKFSNKMADRDHVALSVSYAF